MEYKNAHHMFKYERFVLIAFLTIFYLVILTKKKLH